MNDLISRQAAIDAIKTWGLIDGLAEGQAIEILADKEKLPPAQPEAFEKGFRIGASKVQKKRGKWIERESGTEDKENGFETVIVCSCCDFPATTFYSEDCESRTQIRTDFCPNCGADMR